MYLCVRGTDVVPFYDVCHLNSPQAFSWVPVTRSLVLYVCFVDRCLSFCIFSFGHCCVCSSSIYGFWLPLWYLQTLLSWIHIVSKSKKLALMYLCVRGTDVVPFYDVCIRFWNCSISVVFFVFYIVTLYTYIYEYQCGLRYIKTLAIKQWRLF
jgi:hypothetical protein